MPIAVGAILILSATPSADARPCPTTSGRSGLSITFSTSSGHHPSYYRGCQPHYGERYYVPTPYYTTRYVVPVYSSTRIVSRSASSYDVLDRTMVRKIQRALWHRGYLNGSIDGVFGRQTSRALAHFQSDSGLRPTGRIDVDTLRSLRVY